MLKSYFSRRNLDKLLSNPDFKDSIPLSYLDKDNWPHYLVMKNGEPVWYHRDSLYPVDAFSKGIPKLANFRWVRRCSVGTEYEYNRARTLIAHIEMRTAGHNSGIHFLTWKDTKYYLMRDSIQGEFIVLYTQGGVKAVVPSVVLREYPRDWFSVVDQYTAQIVDMCCPDSRPTYRPIIEIKNSRVEPLGTYTRLVAVENCPGMFHHVSYDVIIHINALDNSANPVVNLAPFIRSIHSRIKHDCTEWGLDIDKIQLSVGMLPNPIAIKDLATELPNHRFWMDTSLFNAGFDTKKYTYTAGLPTRFP